MGFKSHFKFIAEEEKVKASQLLSFELKQK